MPSGFYILLGVAVIIALSEAVSYARNSASDKCVKQQDKCQNCSEEYFTTKLMGFDLVFRLCFPLLRLSASEEVRDAVVKAQNVIMEKGADKVVKLFSPYTLTTSLNYFCCPSDEEKKTIAVMLQAHPGASPQTITYHGVRCMESSDGNIIMFALNSLSEAPLAAWVDDVEASLKDHMVHVVDRKDPFNLQLAVVNSNYPMDDVLTILNNTQFSYDVHSFYVSGTIIHL